MSIVLVLSREYIYSRIDPGELDFYRPLKRAVWK